MQKSVNSKGKRTKVIKVILVLVKPVPFACLTVSKWNHKTFRVFSSIYKINERLESIL